MDTAQHDEVSDALHAAATARASPRLRTANISADGEIAVVDSFLTMRPASLSLLCRHGAHICDVISMTPLGVNETAVVVQLPAMISHGAVRCVSVEAENGAGLRSARVSVIASPSTPHHRNYVCACGHRSDGPPRVSD